jgi:hypothetical protein
MNDVADAIAVGLSSVALTISMYTVWRSRLSPFRLHILSSSPTLTIFAKAAPEGGVEAAFVAYEPNIDCSITAYNTGARSGILSAMRFLATVETGRETSPYVFEAQFAHSTTALDLASRMTGVLETWTQAPWYDLLLAGEREIQLGTIFRLGHGQYWTRPEPMRITLELQAISTMKPGWQQISKFLIAVPSTAFGSGSRTALAVRPENRKAQEDLRAASFEEIDQLQIQT